MLTQSSVFLLLLLMKYVPLQEISHAESKQEAFNEVVHQIAGLGCILTEMSKEGLTWVS